MIDILNNIFVAQFFTVVMIIGLLIVLQGKTSLGPIKLKTFKNVLIVVLILVVADSIELYAAEDPSRRLLRIVMSIIGYCIRPVPVVGMILLTVEDDPNKTGVIWIPEIINIVVFLTALFSPIAFSYDSQYGFTRGPLGYTVFVVSFFYLFVLVLVTFRAFSRTRAKEGIVVIFCSICCIIATGIVVSGKNINALNPTIVGCIALYYIFLNREFTSRDLNTSLLNRTAFYEDLEKNESSISAIATIDMNGLKTINDNWGHHEGDKYLKKIGDTLSNNTDKNVLSYRVGGDEFMVLFIDTDEDEVNRRIEKIRSDSKEMGVSISIGYAIREKNQSLEELHHLSDMKMYDDKRKYYMTSGVDRRKR